MGVNIETKVKTAEDKWVTVSTTGLGKRRGFVTSVSNGTEAPLEEVFDLTYKRGKRTHRRLCKSKDYRGREYMFNPQTGGYEPREDPIQRVIEILNARRTSGHRGNGTY